ncbi:MAG: hypothetical protein ACYCWW_05790 [Deltaproteobacteria bacterium]
MDTIASAPPPPGRAGRRHYLVDLRFQLKYTALAMAFGGAIMALFGAAVWREVRTNSELLEGNRIAAGLLGGPHVNGFSDFEGAVGQSDHRLLLLVIGASLIVMAGVGLCGVLMSHRVAGPLLILSRYTRELGEGRLPKIRPLRKGDELQAHFEVLRQAVDRIRGTQAKELEVLDVVVAQLSKHPDLSEARGLVARVAEAKRSALQG